MRWLWRVFYQSWVVPNTVATVLGVSSHYSKGITAGSDGRCTVGPLLEAQEGALCIR